ncbi:hypothetical protein DMENIID0001_110000 [Sergentomyia squamirostris]
MIKEVLGRKILLVCEKYGIPEDNLKAWAEKELKRDNKRKRRYLVPWRSFFFGNRVIITVRPYRKFRARDQLLYRHFNWAAIQWHRFNGLELQIHDFLIQRKRKKGSKKSKKRKIKQKKKKKNDPPSNIVEDPGNVSEDEVQVIESHTLIDLASDEELSTTETSFPKIVSVASAGTVIDKICNVYTPADDSQFVLSQDEDTQDTQNQNSSMEVDEDMKPTNDELERARELFDALENNQTAVRTKPKGTSFLDSIAGKMGVEVTRNQQRTRKSFEDCYNELETTFRQVNEISSKYQDIPIKDEESCSSTEFYGFNENDTQTPGLLRTPVVRQAGSNSAFVSEKCDKLLEKLGSIPVDKAVGPKVKTGFQPKSDDGRVNTDSEPPKLECPGLPQHMKPRTLAEKMQMLKLKPVGYQVMDQENSVYHLLKKRMKEPPNEKLFQQANRILMQPVPMRRNVWKTATWLNTRNDHYIYRYVKHQGGEVKLFGCYGNFKSKKIFRIPENGPLKRKPGQVFRCCMARCYPKNIKFNNVLEMFRRKEEAPVEQDDFLKSLNIDIPKRIWNLKETRRIPPGPLSRKAKFVKEYENLGSLETFPLPRVFLQVSPRVNIPFPLEIRRYLTENCPYESMTEDWIKFALSTMQNHDGTTSDNQEPTEFEIPYENNRRRILVSREVHSRKRKEKSTEVFNADECLTFGENLPDDDLVLECADILEEMIDSVAIGICEDNFSKDDPDLDYETVETIKQGVSQARDECPRFKKPRQNAMMLNELKRLNATIINTESIQREKECKLEQCKMGCICDSISALSYPIRHCERVQCMFECHCDRGLVFNNSSSNSFSKEVFRIRDKAISGLARAEKEFSSTVVLTNNNTFLLSNCSDESNKRNRSAPRRFGDYVENDSKEDGQNDGARRSSMSKKVMEKGPKMHPDLERMRHATVKLVDLGAIFNKVEPWSMEPWCMFHELYRCFCKGEAKNGKPFMLTKISNNCIAMSEELVTTTSSVYMSPPKRPRVFYDPDATTSGMNKSDSSLSQESIVASSSAHSIGSNFTTSYMQYEPTYARYTKLYRNTDYTQNNVKWSVTRCLAFDSKWQLERNRRMSKNVKKYIAANEKSPDILSLLKKRYQESCIKTKIHVPIESQSMPKAPVQFVEATAQESSIVHSQLQQVKQTEQAPLPVISSVKSLGEQTKEVKDTGASAELSVDPEEVIRKAITKRMNMMVSQMILTIANNEEKTTLGMPQINKMTTIKWVNLLNEYRNYRIHIWEVHYPNNRNLVIITKNHMRPNMPQGYEDIIEIRTLKATRLPGTTLCCMLCYSYDLPQIENVAALLCGHRDYWQIIGYIRNEKNLSLNMPRYLSVSRETHPEVADKVNMLYNVLRKRMQNNSPQTGSNVQMVTLDQISDKQFLKFQIPTQPGQRWFMLVITNDFSDISHPNWTQMYSYDRINCAISMAQKHGRTIQVKSLNPSVYVAPDQADKIFIGPYDFNEDSNIVLHQRLDGNLMRREIYEKKTNVQREKSTIGCWIEVKAIPVQKEVNQAIMLSDVESDRGSIVPTADLSQDIAEDSSNGVDTSKASADDDDSSKPHDDDDCVLLEADPKEIKAAEEAKEAEVAVNSILPDGLRLPVESPRKTYGSQPDSQQEPGRIRVIPPHLLSARASVSPVLEDDSSQRAKKIVRKRKIENISETAKNQAKLLPKDLTILPVDEDEMEKRPWNISPPAAKITVVTVAGATVSNSQVSNFPIITSVTSQSPSTIVTQPTIPVISKVVSLNQNNTPNVKAMPRIPIPPIQVPDLHSSQVMPSLVSTAAPKRVIYVMKPSGTAAVSGVSSLQMKVPMEVAKSLDEMAGRPNGLIRVIQSNSSFMKTNPISLVASAPGKPGEPLRIITPPQQRPMALSPITTGGKNVMLRQVSAIDPPPKLPVLIKPAAITTTIGQKRKSPPPLTTLGKRIRVDDAKQVKRIPIFMSKPSTASTSTEPRNTFVRQIGQTNITSKVPQLPVVASLAHKLGLNHPSGPQPSTSTKSVDGLVCNGSDGQMMKVRINFTPPGPSTVTTTMVLPKNTTIKSIPASNVSNIASQTLSVVTSSTGAKAAPMKVAVAEGNKTVMVTKTTADGKSLKYILPVSKVSASSFKIVQSANVTKVAASSSTTRVVQAVKPTMVTDKEVSQEKPPVAAKSVEVSKDQNKSDVVIELSDDEDDNVVTQSVTKVYVDSTAKEIRDNVCRGYIISNIPQLGIIPARKSSEDVFLTLPIRQHPFKVGLNCLDRYMDRYMRYCVAVFLPSDLNVKWEFHECDRPDVPGERFTMQSTANKVRMALTQYGVIDMNQDISDTLVEDPFIYTKLLLLRLGYICKIGSKAMKASEVVKTAVSTIAEQEEKYEQLTKEKGEWTEKVRVLTARLGNMKSSSKSDPPSP